MIRLEPPLPILTGLFKPKLKTYLRHVSEGLYNNSKRNLTVFHHLEVAKDSFSGGAHQVLVTIKKSIINHWFITKIGLLHDWLLELLLNWLLGLSCLRNWCHRLLDWLLLLRWHLLLVSKLNNRVKIKKKNLQVTLVDLECHQMD